MVLYIQTVATKILYKNFFLIIQFPPAALRSDYAGLHSFSLL